MSKAKYTCPNCGSPVLKARWQAGYEYCKDRRCFEALGRRVLTYEVPKADDEHTVYDIDEVAEMFGEGD